LDSTKDGLKNKSKPMTLQIDTLAYNNRLRKLPPEHKLLFAFALLG
jgi:hypothetical protein